MGDCEFEFFGVVNLIAAANRPTLTVRRRGLSGEG